MLLTAVRRTARRDNGRGARGFTLIETSIALLVIMIALLGLSSVFVYGINYNSGAHLRAVAMAVAQQRMESLRQGVFDEVVSSSEPDVTSAGYHFTVATDVTTSGNLRTVTVTVTPKAGSPWMRRPVVLVTQRAGTGTGAYYQ
jgi:Tfp pilus assembly protein PilV